MLSAIGVPSVLVGANRGALALRRLRAAHVWDPMSVGRHFFAFIECVQDNLAIHDVPSLHSLVSNIRVVLGVVEVRLPRWNLHTRRHEVKTLV